MIACVERVTYRVYWKLYLPLVDGIVDFALAVAGTVRGVGSLAGAGGRVGRCTCCV